jgi:adenosylhomocysteine nucleosidase
METIGVIAAMSQERDACLRLIEVTKRSVLDKFLCHRFQLSDRECWLVTSGMGLKRAAQATRALLSVTSPNLLISIGVAGAVHTDLEIGDVVASRNSYLLEKGVPDQMQPLAFLSESAWQAAVQALQPHRARLVTGTALTTRGSQYIQLRPEEMENPVLEMETVGIAQVAAEHGIPLLSLRAISDGPRAPIPFDLEKLMDKDYNVRAGPIIKTIIGHPQMLPQLLRMVRNTRMATENAAIALVAALSQPGPVISL